MDESFFSGIQMRFKIWFYISVVVKNEVQWNDFKLLKLPTICVPRIEHHIALS